jgi:hypothetical protein
MGFRDKIKEQVAEQQATQEATRAAVADAASSCPAPTSHYVTEVNKGSIRMQTWQAKLNDMYGRGYRLTQVFEQDGNTVHVFEHHFHA